MKIKFLVLNFLLIIITSFAFSQNGNGWIRYIAEKSDKNIIPDNNPTFAVLQSDKCFIIDGNESKGYIELVFERVSASKVPQTITLIANCADVEYAESLDGFSVFLGSQKLGNSSVLNRNSRVEIPLDIDMLKSNNNFTLTLKANGEDGLYLLSKKSGFGPFLVITY
jgi:hypothetical protein